jgi:hypothetical protein
MTSKIEKRQLRTDKNIQQLPLVYSTGRTPDQLFKQILAEAIKSINKKTVVQITYALMCRLRIPHTSTIVGMLGVGLSRSNFEEMSKWVVRELPTVASENVPDSFQIFERRFRQAIDQFPED